MNDDVRDEVPVPHFEDELWPTLAQAHAAQRWGKSSPNAQPPPHMFDPTTRRRGRRLLTAGVGTIAAAAALVAAIVVNGGGDGPETTTNPTTSGPDAPVELSLAAKITAATEEASASSVVHMMQDMRVGPGDSEMWSDEQSGGFRSRSTNEDGVVTFDSGPAVAPGLEDTGPGRPPSDMAPNDPARPQILIRQVDYCYEQYTEYEQPAIPGRNEGELIGERLAEGSLVEDGREIVDGRELIRLVEVPVLQFPPALPETSDTESDTPEVTTTVPGTQPAPTTTVDPGVIDQGMVEHIYFVDPETNRPVRILGYPGDDAEYVMTIEYLPRTAENLALLSPPIPEGFAQVAIDQFGGDGERYERCGA